MREEGLLVVVSGFSGAGKGTVMKELLERYGNYALSISATTRSPRPGEEEGRHYFYKTEEEFLRMIEEGGLIEYARYVDHYYGTPKAYVEAQREAGKDVILEIEIQGALKVKEQYPDALLLFLTPPSAAELKRRLEGRGTEDSAAIASRLRRAAEEARGVEKYDYVIVNDDLDECVEEMHRIIQGEHCRSFRNAKFMKEIKEDLERLKGED